MMIDRVAPGKLPRGRMHDVAALLIILAVWLIFFWRLFTPVDADRVQFASGDFTLQFLAFRHFGLSELQQDRWPLWMPCVDSGYPYFADPQAASFYPPVLLNYAGHLVSGMPEFSLSALQLEAALHVLLAALLTYLFLRGEVRSRTAALIGALVFAFGGYLTGYPVLQLAILESAAWLPLAVWSARRLATKRDRRSVAVLALALALSVLAGHPQTYTLVWYLTGAYYLYWVWREQSGWTKALARFAMAVMLAFMLSAVQLIPTFEFMRLSTRADLPYTVAGAGFPLSDIWQMIVPGALSHFSPLYVGLLPLALTVFAIGAYGISRKSNSRSMVGRDTPFWLAAALIGLLISFGSNLAIFDGLYWFMPGYRVFRNQERDALIVSFALAVLSAYGADVLLHSLTRRLRAWLRREIRWLVGLVVLLGLASLVQIYLSAQSGSREWANQTTLAALLLALAAGLLAMRAYRPVRLMWLAALMVGVVALDLITIDRAVNWVVPYDPFPAQLPLEAIRADANNTAVFRLHNEQRLPGHAACMVGLNEVGGITPIHVGYYQDFIKQVPREVRWQLLNVGYVVTWRSVLDDHLGRPVDATLLDQQGEGKDATYTYRLNEKQLRAWIVHEVAVNPDRDAIYAMLAAPDFDPRRVAYVPKSIDVVTNQAIEPASIVTSQPDRLVVDTDLTTPGLLVMSEVNYPGWTATVNGSPTPIMEVDGLLRGVALPGGSARVELYFRPGSLTTGGVITALGVVLCIVLIVVPVRRREVKP
jgi:hypothetical protein